MCTYTHNKNILLYLNLFFKEGRNYYSALRVNLNVNSEKEYTFTLEEKKEFLTLALEDMPNVKVDAFDGLTADYMHEHGITKIIRGIRSNSDEEYEKKLASLMKAYDSEFETIFIRSHGHFKHISSTMVREYLKKGEDVSDLLPEKVVERVMEAYNSKLEK